MPEPRPQRGNIPMSANRDAPAAIEYPCWALGFEERAAVEEQRWGERHDDRAVGLEGSRRIFATRVREIAFEDVKLRG